MKDKKVNSVFIISLMITMIFSIVGILVRDSFLERANALMSFLKNNFSWMYLLIMMFFVIFCLIIAFSKFGKIRLGSDDEKPEYSTISWFSMLFCAGMGVGLVFWGISEPLSHYVSPITGIEPQTEEAARFAIRSCFMHWGLHPWACYAVVGLCLAYTQYRKKEKGLVSSLFIPLFGRKKVEGKVGKVIDIFAVVLTVVGVATSFGMGCMQICNGMNYLFGIPDNVRTWILVIVIIACCYLKSATSGVGKGIKILSNFNLVLSIVLLISSFIIGPTVNILNIMTNGIGEYVMNFFGDSLRINPFGDNTWIFNWRVFYWAWWIGWAPFVGIFIARISKGRTIREFICGVILAPTIASIFWFSVFGGVGLNVAEHFSLDQLSQMVASPQTALFIIFHEYKFGIVLSILTIILLITFFITSADSATFVLAMMTSEGEDNPSDYKKIIWGILQAVFAFVLIVSGGVSAVQVVSIVMAFPFLFIMVGACVSLVKALRKEKSQ